MSVGFFTMTEISNVTSIDIFYQYVRTVGYSGIANTVVDVIIFFSPPLSGSSPTYASPY